MSKRAHSNFNVLVHKSLQTDSINLWFYKPFDLECHSLKYQRFTTSGCKYKEIRKNILYWLHIYARIIIKLFKCSIL